MSRIFIAMNICIFPVHNASRDYKGFSPAVSLIQNVDHESLRVFVTSIGPNASQILPVIRRLAEIMDTLHYMGLHHGQLFTKHILINTANPRVSGSLRITVL